MAIISSVSTGRSSCPRTELKLRGERPGDENAIGLVAEAAFARVSHSNHNEPMILRELRNSGRLTLSLVVDIDGEIAGHIAFSSVAISGQHQGWFGLGPLCVLPSRQHQGYGSTLVREGLARLRARSTAGCIVLGAPKFYRQFGFVNARELRYGTLPRHLIQALAFEGAVPSGALAFAPAFDLAG